MITVVLLGPAEEQLHEIAEWWMEHREASPSLVMDEFDAIGKVGVGVDKVGAQPVVGAAHPFQVAVLRHGIGGSAPPCFIAASASSA